MNTIKKITTQKVAYTGNIPNTPLAFIWAFSMRQKKWVVISTLAVIIAATLVTATNLLFKFIVDNISAGNLGIIFFLALAYPALVYAETLFWRLSGFMGMNWVTKMEYDIYNNLVAYTLKHSHNYFINRFAGSLLSKVDNVAESANQLVHDYLSAHLETSVLIITSFILIYRVDTLVGVLSTCLLVLLIILNKNVTPRQGRLSLRNAETYTTLRGHIVDTFTNISAVRQHSARDFEEQKLDLLAEESRVAHKNSWFYSELVIVLNMTVVFIFTVVIMYILALRWQAGLVTAGDLVLMMVIFSTITGSLTRLGRAFNQTAKAFGKMKEGLSVLISAHEIEDKPNAQQLVAKGGEIEWKNVSFVYAESPVFTNFSLTIKPGQRVGLVGPSGAGKTTFVSLLLRQHDIQGGAITIDGQNIAEVTQDSLREHIAVVPQEPMLFHRSIRENIAYGKPGATDKEIIEVAKKAQAHDFIMKLEEGYDTMVGERGVKLSGGQKQRVAIARAMLKDAPILVLDEATSALDSESEVLIQQALEVLMEGKTVIAVAHRLSTLREMDRIIVLEAGKIVEDGNHATLSKGSGTYARLWAHQAGGFLQD